MTRHLCLALCIAFAGGAACASSGAVPRPFPGAALPPSSSTPATATATPETQTLTTALVTTALTLRGTPYRNGGTEPSTGFDCSGFVQWVFAQHSTPLPREVREQYSAGQAVKEKDLRPGDLVFFQTVKHGPSHVGIAIGGDEFVHAPSSRGVVRVERLTSEYWATRWVGARRIDVPLE